MAIKNPENHPIVSRRNGVPLVLVAGFLGAGKTSLLRALIPEVIAAGRKPVVVINDFQNALVDAERLREFQIAVAPVSGSCVCCGSRDELMDLLEKIELPENSVLLLEANGTTDTASLIELLTLDRRALRYSYPVEICVIDAKRWGKRMFYDFLEKSQLQTASYVFVSRQDQVKPARWQQVLDEISGYNPLAQHVTPADFAKIIASEFFFKKTTRSEGPAACDPHKRESSDCFDDCHTADAASQSQAHGRPNQPLPAANHTPHENVSHVRHTHSETDEQELAHEHEAHGHDSHHFASLEVLLPDRVNKNEVAAWLQKLPHSVLRVKGLAKLEPEGWHVFEMVEDLREILFHSVKGEPVVSPRAVLIGPRLCPDEISQSLRSNWPKKNLVFV